MQQTKLLSTCKWIWKQSNRCVSYNGRCAIHRTQEVLYLLDWTWLCSNARARARWRKDDSCSLCFVQTTSCHAIISIDHRLPLPTAKAKLLVASSAPAPSCFILHAHWYHWSPPPAAGRGESGRTDHGRGRTDTMTCLPPPS